jgi:ribosomal-protein-serine acetyltransferase
MNDLAVDGEIHLRLLQPSDAEPLFALVDAKRSHLLCWLPWLDANVAASDTLAFIHAVQKQHAENSAFVCGIWYRGELAGVVGHNRIDWENRVCWPGYRLGEGFQNRGIMTRSCRALIGHAFGELGLNRADIRCALGNARSRAIPERLSFQQEGVIREAQWLYDWFSDHMVYGILASEWRG